MHIYVCMYMYVFLHPYLCPSLLYPPVYILTVIEKLKVCMYIYGRMYLYVHINICIQTYLYICSTSDVCHLSIHICVHICIYYIHLGPLLPPLIHLKTLQGGGIPAKGTHTLTPSPIPPNPYLLILTS
jgi:hypothetical protein